MRLSSSNQEDSAPDVRTSAYELSLDISRDMFNVTAVAFVLWLMALTMTQRQAEAIHRAWLIAPIFLATWGLSSRLLQRHLWLSQAVWQAGLFLGITLVIRFFGQPDVALLYVVLPLMATVAVGWPAGLLSEVCVVAITRYLSSPLAVGLLPAESVVQLAFGSALAGLVGWAAARTLITVTQWSLSSFRDARRNLELARQHRARLSQVVRDLDRAYYRLQRVNSALVAARQEAEEAKRFKSELAALVSHELRTPLNLIVGFSEMIVTSPASYGDIVMPGVYRRDLNTIYRSAQHILALVDDVLDLTSIDEGSIGLIREEVSLAPVMDEAVAMVGDYVRSKGLELRVREDREIPALRIDRLRIRQVLLNLLVNAVRFTDRGSIELDASMRETEVLVRVTDTGRGIPEQDLPRVFEEFRTAPTEPLTGWHSGSGLGLPISKRLVELHGGTMGIESEHLRGTCVWFTLPLDRGGAPSPRASGLVRSPFRERTTKLERVVVAIHDDQATLQLLRRHLSEYTVLHAPDIGTGQEMATEAQALAIIAQPDIAMPRSLPIIRCDLPGSGHIARRLGANGFLAKPVVAEDLWSAIDRLEVTPERVLIVDDDREMVILLQRMLHSRAPEIVCLEAYNGAEAISAVESQDVDLLLLDLVMPEKTGYQVLEHLATSDRARPPVIVIAGAVSDSLLADHTTSLEISRSQGLDIGQTLQLIEGALDVLGTR